jgi:nicotinate-nucleotide adenylyltransferase
MVHALVDGETGLEVSDAEIRRGGPSYTVTTLRELRAANGDAELFLIIGRDLVDDFPSWHESVDIGRLATIVVVDRPGYVTDAQREWKMLVVPPIDVSSTELRDRLQSHQQDGSAPPTQISPAVLDVIRSRGLYQRSVRDAASVQQS